MPRFTESEVVTAYKTGLQIESVTEYMYSTYYPTIRELCRRLEGNVQDCEDLFQETLLIFIELVQAGRYNPHGSATLKTYLYSIARNVWSGRWKRSVRQQNWEKNFADTFYPEQDTIDLYINQMTAMQMLNQLGEPCRTIISRYYIEGFSLDEIARELDLNEPTVRQRKFRCLKKLRDML
ncbi:RNA polymerase sigma factor [Larkinella terrae]|uniref:Sigma-70 family RNA polymerase sigma factor n=1 Tax=Larkinella terrae TaxID=2025311 RepID=A0A7K0EEQ4_9BACT|nr:sigma-70 family RNA polymerase sigma factor [Larkinella terrae]MRS60320.1 sigma-70 family RNA polymerase sigma factor [Larkinella terrae]